MSARQLGTVESAVIGLRGDAFVLEANRSSGEQDDYESAPFRLVVLHEATKRQISIDPFAVVTGVAAVGGHLTGEFSFYRGAGEAGGA
jgi:hypothetical protein